MWHSKLRICHGRSHCGAVETNTTSIHEDVGSNPWPPSVGRGSGIAVSCGIGRRRGSDPTLLWLWHRPVAVAPIRPLAWEPPHASGVAQEKAKRQKIKIKKKKLETSIPIVTQQVKYPT